MNFKVGDWVEIFSSIHQIEIIDYEDENCVLSTYPNRYRTKLNDLRLWQPKEGEWCWYKHCLVKVLSIRDTSYQVSAPMFGEQWTGSIELEPFTNQLPNYIKDK